MINRGSMGLAALLAVAFSAGCASSGATANNESNDSKMMNSDSCGRKVEGNKKVVESFAKTGDRVYFDLNRSELLPAGLTVSEKQAEVLNKNKRARVRIEGNADERGTREYNVALGIKRAESLKSRLVAMGIDSSRISTLSHGEECPSVAESNEAAWAKNRRDVVISVK